MNLAETHQLLTRIAAVDNRIVDDPTVIMWQAILGDDEAEDATRAVIDHFRSDPGYLTPAHVHRRVVELREERDKAKAHMVAVERARAIPGGELTTIVHADMPEQKAEIRALVASVAAKLPQLTNLDKARARARAERGLQRKPQPKGPRTAAKKRVDYPNPMTDSAVAMVAAYLEIGWDPREVSERLGVSKRWCEREAGRLKRIAGDAA